MLHLLMADLDPCLAHAALFADRHDNVDAPFHAQLVEDWHSDIPNVLTMAFRGSAKSTKAEEAIAIEVGLKRVRNVVILGESETRAAERLAAIKHIIEFNEEFQETFEVGPGDPWQETRACTSTGVMMQAYGRGQSLRGVKHLDARPDFIFLDDVEDKESGSVSTPEARKKTRSWLAGTVIPALAPGGRMRMAATPLHPEALAPTLAKADKSWTTRTIPIAYRDQDGQWTSNWPDRFPLEKILEMRLNYQELEELDTFQQEYMCEAIDPSSQMFTPDMFRVEPQIPKPYHAVYAIYDPARTTNKQSATTGKVVASWEGHKLIVWESSARKWMPNEIIDDIFLTNQKYTPVAIGVEENGLNEWLLQPIRSRQIAEGVVLPLRPLHAPKGKFDFIRGLQSYFRAGEVVFASEMPELRSQLLGFPTGFIDAPNALAYMLTMKLGVPIYDNFLPEINVDGAIKGKNIQSYLLINTNNQITTAILCQLDRGRLCILWDTIAEGDAGTVLTDVLKDANLFLVGSRAILPEAQVVFPSFRDLRLFSCPEHFDEYTVYGLRAAARSLGYEVNRGGDPQVGREELRGLIRRPSHGHAAIGVGSAATWTARGFVAGYARDPVLPLPIENAYAVLMAPLESFAATMRLTADTLVNPPNYAYTSDGRRFISALAHVR